jgi:hypothetical protein
MIIRTTCTAALALAAHAAFADCVPIKGKVVNNVATASGGTLGVVSAVYGLGSGALKLKCALMGESQGAEPPAIDFVHSISCEDAIAVPVADGSGSVPVHSSIVLATSGSFYPPQTPTQLLTFKEQSVPLTLVPFRGVFADVTGGQIEVEGAVNKSPAGAAVPGSIDMKFSGQLCSGG